MKEGIHPTFYPDAVFTCGSCGTKWTVGSTKKDVHVDICSSCHPFFTGTQRIVDTAGQVERFTKRMQAREAAVEAGQVQVSKKQRRAQERAKRSGVLEPAEPEPAVEPVAQAAGTESVADASAPETPAPRARKPRPPREQKPRENKPVEPAPPADQSVEPTTPE